jgi:eukaryotic-like serine/threonine-protein kinase
MATGRAPFQGERTGTLLLSIVQETPEPLRQIRPDLPEGLEQIVDKCLQKDREHRYQSASEIRNDLRQLQRSLSSEKSRLTEVQDQAPGAGAATRSKPGPASKDSSVSGEPVNKHSNRKQAGRLKKIRITVAALAVAMVLFAALYAHFHGTYALRPQDTLVFAEFTNTTGDPVFDGALREALEIDLTQSPFINVLSQRRVTATLKQMEKAGDERLTVKNAREICLRTNSKALIAGSIALVGEHYTLNLRVLDCQNEEVLASVGSEAENRSLVLPALHKADEQLRRKLGESLDSLKAFNLPLAEATTSSLEALQLYSQGQAERQTHGSVAGIPYLKRAIDVDHNFGLAYASLGSMYLNTSQWGLAKSSYRSAYELSNRASERERFLIEFYYFRYITDESDTVIRVCDEWIRSYPNDSIPHSRLGSIFLEQGKFDRAAQEYREALRLGTDTPYSGAMVAYLRLGRFDEAKAMFDAARSHNLDSDFLRLVRDTLAFLEDDDRTIQEQLNWAKGKPGYEETLLNAQSEIEAYHGHIVKARDLEQQAKSATSASDERERAAEFDADSAWREAEIGNNMLTRKYASQALAVSDSPYVRARVAMASARAGDNSTSEQLAAQLNADYPHSIMFQNYVLPTIRALIAMNSEQPDRAIAVLQPALYVEYGEQGFGNLQPAYVRGLAYLQLKRGKEAAIEFRKLIGHPGIVGFSITGALVHLQLARAEEMSGNHDVARRHYQDFLALWKDADPNIPILMQAKAEYAKVG